jgi:hypothetical protein
LKSPIRAAAELLGIFIAMSLAVGGILRVVNSPNAVAAIAPDTSIEATVAAAASACPEGQRESSASDSPGRASMEAENSGE